MVQLRSPIDKIYMVIERCRRFDPSREINQRLWNLQTTRKKALIICFGTLEPSLLEELANYEQQALCLATRNNIPAHIVDIMSQSASEAVRMAVAARDDLTPQLASRLFRDASLDVRNAVGYNEHLDGDALHLLLDMSLPSFGSAEHEWFRNRDNFLTEDLYRMAASSSSAVRGVAASSANLPPELIEVLSVDPEYRIRLSIACNKNLPPHVIDRLANDDEYLVLVALLESHQIGADRVDNILNRDWKRENIGSLLMAASGYQDDLSIEAMYQIVNEPVIPGFRGLSRLKRLPPEIRKLISERYDLVD